MNYQLVFCTDRELPEWLVVSGHNVVFKSFSREEAECMLQEFLIVEQGNEIDNYLNQLTEFDYV